jgi:hypothetical protein
MDTQALVMEAVQAVADRRLGSSNWLESTPAAVQYAVEDLWLRIAQVCTVVVKLEAGAIELTAIGLTTALAAELYRHAVDPTTYRWAHEACSGTLAEQPFSSDHGVCVRLACSGAARVEQEDTASWALHLGHRLRGTQLRDHRPLGCAR